MKNTKLQVYYDGECCLCRAEISLYEQQTNEIEFVDICKQNFSAQQHGLENDDIHVNLHVRSNSGEMYRGIDAFVAIWENTSGFETFARIVRIPFFYFCAKGAYAIFIRIRPFLPRKSLWITRFFHAIIKFKWKAILWFVKWFKK
ncbi:thiol-disulfide oxidoreductase DCC family protein [Candidatus Uabimicrobium sp. HlEnr_7]|uniref:thiol-disulfide oxidoreductase DCC family protein n=1 Tax=Candidatus Uabimicrobium helgolandensis TaxID=3095367 RepID=UPI0035565647